MKDAATFESVKENFQRLIKIEKTQQEYWHTQIDHARQQIGKHHKEIMNLYRDWAAYEKRNKA